MKDNNIHKERHLRYAAELILAYNGDEPFHLYLKRYFREHKKHGSRDRRNITSLCYHYFRLGNGILNPMRIDEKLSLGDYLNSNTPDILHERLKEETGHFDALQIFPFNDYLSNHIEKELFNLSFLQQPLLFVRIRPGFRQHVLNVLSENKIQFEQLNDNCLSFENNTAIEKLFRTDKEVVIQDYNSQQAALFFEKMEAAPHPQINIWDCCAGSGGKSILAADFFRRYKLTVSDKRKSILANLQKRFRNAGIKNFKIIMADLSKPVSKITGGPFDLIIADVPCSGSGTWGRTPEQMHCFDKNEIDEYTALQRTIITNSISYLKKDGYLLYLTCSVFEKENEDNTKFLSKENGLKIMHQQYLKGYEMKADTLFGSLMKKIY
ncbi:MAG TPA: methyltransferase domain-containing protein [Niabella sp.]|nr:methyltransferase domain-containing protein [Chitinophagaceae bacterium]HRO83504.1 methyltransferase domain-containing protein [Niabella sp.]